MPIAAIGTVKKFFKKLPAPGLRRDGIDQKRPNQA
jgi:hypothetical protein